MIPRTVSDYRYDYRRREISPFYSGWLHLGFTSSVCLGVLALALLSLHRVAPWELLIVVATFLYANTVEYLLHRFPMHRRFDPLRILHTRHTLQHHRFFTSRAMSYETSRDFKMVMFPPTMVVLFVVTALPAWYLIGLLASGNASWLFLATAVGYFLSYELLHFAYHLPEDSFIARLPFMAALRRHHTAHHDVKLMSLYNFNVTFPICDRLFGTIATIAEPKRRTKGARRPAAVPELSRVASR